MSELPSIQNNSFSLYELNNYSALEVLGMISPEIAAIAYAKHEKIITPDMYPLIANFRQMQSNEKIALLEAFVQKIAIESDERKNEVFCYTQEKLEQLRTNGAITIERIHSDSEVEREKIRSYGETNIASINAKAEVDKQLIKSNAKLDAQKLIYETNVAMIKYHCKEQKYLSDNQLRVKMEEIKLFEEHFNLSFELNKKHLDSMNEINKSAIQANLTEKIHQSETQRYISDNEFKATMFKSETQTHISDNEFKATMFKSEAELKLGLEKIKNNSELRKKSLQARVINHLKSCEMKENISNNEVKKEKIKKDAIIYQADKEADSKKIISDNQLKGIQYMADSNREIANRKEQLNYEIQRKQIETDYKKQQNELKLEFIMKKAELLERSQQIKSKNRKAVILKYIELQKTVLEYDFALELEEKKAKHAAEIAGYEITNSITNRMIEYIEKTDSEDIIVEAEVNGIKTNIKVSKNAKKK